ncbi:hypothetical protein E3983_07435 [Legionella israelensis]|uniref:Uncharacterized protein n=1 Tax=Legionella israelensis TaxID=454 RepID=A0A0W0VMU1_9GAMM|nr:MTH938/NDUFAF3 family protein [Legionella israelensis]KTD21472.1 hypothetical protein Lisr_1581 [Legionella israelensis]QBR84206.1 hypothetical protein E3983_07435 [Legionella israelensis]QBS08467.1 hypothetical protein E4T55_00500 [Legionella israelensis]QDP72689.1 hypothetical protein FOG18_09035 [Legionella israelensis]SCY16328.1 Uncharacterized conserved protein, contains Mth938-like domain [Legionella israelensis DSM 19235]
MHLHLEKRENHAVEAYSENEIKINAITYQKSLIVSQDAILSELSLQSIQEIDENFINRLIEFSPEVIIIGHSQPGHFLSAKLISQLSKQRIGIECMSIGAACRTYNVLLNERAVVAVFIF